MPWLLSRGEKFLHSIENFKNNQYGNFVISYRFDHRFPDDKIYFETKSEVIIIDGVLLNKSELLEEFSVESFEQLLRKLIKLQFSVEEIISKFRGPFSGCYLNKVTNVVFGFPNQTGDTAVFYYHNKSDFVISSNFDLLISLLKENKIYCNPNEVAINQLLSFGYLVEENTIAKEIYRIQPGQYIRYSKKFLETFTYHKFKKKVIERSIEDSIELLDAQFKKAIQRCFNKDIEYGYEHLVDMSGGLDSRMVSWVAQELGYKNITNISYAKKNSDEETYASDSAKALGNEFIFRYLDDLKFFYDVDDIVRKNYGMAIYSGITGGRRFLSSINFNRFGLEHTGQLGDVIIGSYCKNIRNRKVDITSLCYSDIITPEISYAHLFEDHDLFALYYRGFMGILSTHYTRRYYTEIVSPFIDVDFIEFCLSMPLEYRLNHKIYWAWIDKKYPKAGKLPSTTKRKNIQSYNIRFFLRILIGDNKRLIIRFLKFFHITKLIQPTNTMNPLDYWYYSTPKIKEFLDSYFNNHISLLDKYPNIKNLVEKVYAGDRVNDKCLAVTVLSAYKNFLFKEEPI